MTIANIDDKHMNNLLERFYDNVNENDISGCEAFEEFFDIAKKEVKLGNRQLIDILSSETAYINSKSAAEVAYTDYQLSTYQLLLSEALFPP